MIKLTNVSKFYSSNDVIAIGLRKVNLELHVNEFVAIVGESGSGKTTLLNVISGIDTYEDGEMYVNGEETSYFSVSDMENFRKKYVAFVFQDYNLIDSYTVLQNVEAPLILSGFPKKKIKQRALEIIKKVGLEDHIHHKATKLSGGQKQRVVIARALAKDCPIIAADEPTGNLDSASAKQIIQLLADIAKDKLVVMVTHDFSQVADYATRKIRIYDGEIVEDKELVKTDKKDLPKLADKEYKMDFVSALKLSLRNLLAVPKKTFLMILVFTFFATFVGLAYGGYLIVAAQSSYSYNQHFNYTNPDRLVVKKADNSPLSAADLAELSNFSQVKTLLDRDYVLDVRFTMSSFSGEINYVLVNFLPLSILGDNVTALYGNVPTDPNKILIAANNEILAMEEAAVGEVLVPIWSDFGNEMYFEIAGVIDNDVIPGNENYNRNYLFVTDEKWEELQKTFYLYSYGKARIDYAEGQGLFRDLSNNFVIDNTLSDNQIKGSQNYFNYICYGTDCNLEATLNVKDYYVDETYDINLILVNDYLTKEVYLNQSTYDKIFYSEIYQVSVMTNSNIGVDNLIRNISRIKDGLVYKYSVVYPYDSVTSSSLEGLLLLIANIGMIFLIIVTMAGSTLITYIIFKAIINTKLHDYAIFRTIGANQSVVKTFIYVENLYIVIISFLIFVGISIAVPNSVPENGLFAAFKVFDLGKYLVFLLLIILMSLFISRKYSNRIFSSSVSKTLKTDLE